MPPDAKERTAIPHDLDAEKSVLSAVMIDNRVLNELQQAVSPDDFFDLRNRNIFRAFLALSDSNQPVDWLTLKQTMQKQGTLDESGGQEYLSQVIEFAPTTANAAFHAGVVRQKSLLRELMSAATGIAREAGSERTDVDQFLDRAEMAIFNIIQKRRTSSYRPIKEIVHEVIEGLNEKARNPDAITGVPTGYSHLDHLTTGFGNSDFIILAARPAMGKTSLALNFAYNAAVEMGRTVAFFTLEMSAAQLVVRLLCSQAEINSEKIRKFDLNPDDFDRLFAAAGKLYEAPIFIDDTSRITLPDLRSKARALKSGPTGLDLVIVDYLQLMSAGERSDSREREISIISGGLKALAKELNIPVIALSQLNRDLEKRGSKKPVLSDLRESGSLEQDADMIMFIYRDEVYNEDTLDKGIAEILVEKYRHGPTGRVRLFYRPEITRFYTHESDDNLPYDQA